LERNLFRYNSVQGGPGGVEGGIGTGGAASAADTATLRSERNRFVENTAEGGAGSGVDNDAAGRGGAVGLDTIPLFGFGKTVFPDGSTPFAGPAIGSSKFDTFHGNKAYGGIGGGIYNEGDLSIKGSTLAENQAIGQATVSIEFVPGYSFVGVGLGGGVSNIGSLDIKNATFEANEAIGGHDADGANFFTDGFANYPGLGVGGGLHNITQASVKNSHFFGNGAIGGDNNFGSFAGVGNGGGIYNDGDLVLRNSSVHNNVASGGDGNEGDINAGGGYGGGVSSGSVTFLNLLLGGEGRDASLDVDRSSIVDNRAIAGAGNVGPDEITLPPPADVTIPVPLAHKPSGGIGGGIAVYQGTASISKSDIVGNRAEGNDSGVGAGGGVFFFGFVGYVNAELSKSTVAHNTAIGEGTGDALGGGIATGSLGSIFSVGFQTGMPLEPNVVVTIDRTSVFDNRAQGGGNGLGGGIYNGYDAVTTLSRSVVTENTASSAGVGLGIGGGVYNEGQLHQIRSMIFANLADIDDDCFGC
jgi:hypothetical protein